MKTVQLTLMAILVLGVPKFGHANSFCSGILEGYLPLSTIQFSGETIEIEKQSFIMGSQTYKIAIVAPEQNGVVINGLAHHYTGAGTRVGVISMEELGKRDPPFGAVYMPARNMMAVVESEKGIRLSMFKHEIRHLDFDIQYHNGETTIFAGRTNQNLEELYTYTKDIQESPSSDRRLDEIDFVENMILIPAAASMGREREPSDLAFNAIASTLESLLAGSQSLVQYGKSTRLFEVMTGDWMKLKDRIELLLPTPQPFDWPKSPFKVAVEVVEIHKRDFLHVTFKTIGNFPVTFIFSSHNAKNVIQRMKQEFVKGEVGPQTQRLYTAALQRALKLRTIVNEMEKRFSEIKSNIKVGGAGDRPAHQLAEYIESHRRVVEPPLN